MEWGLLATRLQIPQPPRRAVRRARLVDALERTIPDYKAVLVSAPAGYGKTTLVAQWARASRFSAVWLSIDPEIDDIDRFLRYLVTGWEQVQPGVGESALGILMAAMAPDTQAALATFVNAAYEAPNPVAFVLDDYHLVRDPTIHDAVAFLLDHLPPAAHVVLVARGEPPLPLARYRARHQLAELRAEDLEFSLQETRDFLSVTMGLDPDPRQVAALHAQLEGWIAGLQLAALTIQQGLTPADRLALSGRHRHIADYLNEDVVGPLSEDLRRFLLQTSILDRLCGPLCDAVTGREDGQEMLERLEKRDLFLVPFDDAREWFRYHRLFAGLLQTELTRHHPDQAADFHRRAARWYLAQDLPEPAFDHAVSAGDGELVIQILERYFVAKLLAGEIKVVERWLSAIPEEWREIYPAIGLVQAGTLLATGRFEACAQTLDRVEGSLAPEESEERRREQARVTAMRCNIACFQNDLPRAEMLADQALQGLPQDDLVFRPGIYGALGDTYRRNGRWAEAETCYQKLLDFTHSPVFRVEAVHVYGALADLDLRQGHLRAAAGYWREALAAIQERRNWGLYPLPVIGWVYLRMGEILYEWNELEQAWDHLTRGLERAELGGDVRALIAGYVIAGRVKLTQGDLDKATRYLEQARPLVEGAQFAYWASRFQRLQLELWLAQGRLQAAGEFAAELLRAAEREDRPESEAAQLAAARALIVAGPVEQAQAWLERLRRVAEREGRTGIRIEALALEALAAWKRGDGPGALAFLEGALRLAEPEGYVRTFADLGLPMARLLQEARSRDVMPEAVDRLLAAAQTDVASIRPAGGILPEPLTDRERQVLQLLAAGLTNREIAARLVISPGTVKKHAGNIYSKLGVGNRTEAAARARELHLLP